MTLFILMVAGLGLLASRSGGKKGRPTDLASGRWAEVGDMADLLADGPGLCVGYVKDGKRARRVRLNGATHVLVTAPSGSGKGTSIIVPFLRSHTRSLVVFDPKGENYDLCKTFLEANGVPCQRLDPYGLLGAGGACLNPLDQIADGERLIDDARALAKEVVVRTGLEQDTHWLDVSEQAIAAAICFVCLRPPGDKYRNLNAVRELLAGKELFHKMLAALRGTTSHAGKLAVMGQSLANAEGKELASILSTLNRVTAFLDTVSIARSVECSTFDVRDLVRGRLALFVVLPPSQVKAQAAWARLVIGTTIRVCIDAGLSRTDTVTYVLDEAAALGQIDCLETALAIGRGYRIRLLLFMQSLGQLKQCWKDGMDTTVLGNTVQVYFGINDYDTAEMVSSRLGEETIWVDSHGSNAGSSTTHNENGTPGNWGGSRGRSTNRSLAARRLLKPEELLALPRTTCISFPGGHPVASHLVAFFEETTPARRTLLGRLVAAATAPSGPTSALRTVVEVTAVWAVMAAAFGALWLAGF